MSIATPLPTTRPCWGGHYTATEIRKERRGLLRVLTPIYHVRLNSDLPLCLYSSDGRIYRPEMEFESDGGSIPSFVQTIRLPGVSLRRDAFLRPYFLHDSGCIDHGLYIWDGTRWSFTHLTRAKVDWLLRDGMVCDQSNAVERALVYGFVRAYSKACVNW